MRDAFHEQIKAAQRDLIRAAGSIDRVVRLTSYGKSTVGRWNNPADPEHMPLTVVRMLESDTDQPLITTILAHETGRKLSEPDGQVTDAVALDALARQALVDVVDMVGSITGATSDGHVTPAEGTVISTPASRLADTVRRIQQLVGAVKAGGGLKIVAGE